MKFEQPFWFLLLAFIPVYLFLKGKKGILYPSINSLPEAKTFRVRFIFLRDLFILLGLILLITASAGPYRIIGEEKDYSKGYLLQLVVDRSGSMGSFMDKQGERNRLDIVKNVLNDFISGDERLGGRAGDRIGLISFALYADTMAPLTISHDVVLDLVATLQLADENEDGTSLGDALSLAVARNIAAIQNSDIPASGSVVILLTDGRNNSGISNPLDAAELAANYGIKVYTIGFGGGYYRNAFGFIREIPPEYGIDEDSLREIADITGGRYFNAGDEKALARVYETIDELEKVDLENVRHTEKELYFMTFIMAGLILMGLGFICRYLIFNVVEGE